MNVDQALAWAWRDELPKAPRIADGPDGYLAAWRKVSGYGEYLTLVDRHGINRYGVVPDFSASAWPHPDAVRLHEAVAALDGAEVDLPDDWQPAPELTQFGGLAMRAIARAVRAICPDGRTLRIAATDLVLRHVILGDSEAWRMEPTEQKIERHADGRPRWFVRSMMPMITGVDANGTDIVAMVEIETNGMTVAGKLKPGAHQKHYLDPDPLDTLIARAHREVLADVMAYVFETCSGQLETIDLQPPELTARPWETGEAMPARVLPDLRRGRGGAVTFWRAYRERFPRDYQQRVDKARWDAGRLKLG
ncbi:hypothetical protein [uncultured Hoeflea sp.]|uniref:hypothetical protein n=1 Tax=uncultured Hoeflea sp. TaxID=538666 RepID=UPI00260E9746|nr:hypothetical protein [uncultured Hoeflea sp.]